MSQLPSSTIPSSTRPFKRLQSGNTIAWQNSLQALFHLAKDRFPDVVWEPSQTTLPTPTQKR